LITHAATAIALVRTFVGDRKIQMKAGCCTLSVLERKGNINPGLIIGGWKPQRISYEDHLTGGAAREWGFEDVEVEEGRVSVSLLNSCWILELMMGIQGCGRPRNTRI